MNKKAISNKYTLETYFIAFNFPIASKQQKGKKERERERIRDLEREREVLFESNILASEESNGCGFGIKEHGVD
ncbi:hypothetical protein BpHYR1_011720 [Brachionus plicatilis]|uniref:Uncharacterized protein n=1 Tax=Brachionus plicatilis TaxID=10195 RepID=A0A3M7SKB0_BRAPC|nr:hypothetical protein BpHYR1_011720 [Brachionus plicatilis]